MNETEQKAYIFGSIFALSNRLQVIGDQFDPNITIKQWFFIVSVSKFTEPPTISEVADYIGYSRQNAKRIASALEEQGFLTITKDPNDARALRVALTLKCYSYFAERGQRELEFLNTLFDGFDEERLNFLYSSFLRLAENMEKLGEYYETVEE